jgi:23S rRNA pseudouridine1911/1915/1917 synthase
MDEVKKYLKEKYNKPGNVFLGMLHRLDRPVSGVVLFAKTSKGAARLSEQFRTHSIKKIYHALTVNEPKIKSGTLIHYLKKDKAKNIVTAFDKPVGDAQRAELDYEFVKKINNESLLKIILKTGRSHQIRTQLQAIGCPIVGDVKYGGPEWGRKQEIALCATDLEFKPATADETKSIHVDVPEYWII